MKFLPRRTFEQIIHKFGLRHLNNVSLHEGRNRICDEQYCIKEYKMLYSFSFTRFFIPKSFPSKILTMHILLSMDTQRGMGVMKLMVVH